MIPGIIVRTIMISIAIVLLMAIFFAQYVIVLAQFSEYHPLSNLIDFLIADNHIPSLVLVIGKQFFDSGNSPFRPIFCHYKQIVWIVKL